MRVRSPTLRASGEGTGQEQRQEGAAPSLTCVRGRLPPQGSGDFSASLHVAAVLLTESSRKNFLSSPEQCSLERCSLGGGRPHEKDASAGWPLSCPTSLGCVTASHSESQAAVARRASHKCRAAPTAQNCARRLGSESLRAAWHARFPTSGRGGDAWFYQTLFSRGSRRQLPVTPLWARPCMHEPPPPLYTPDRPPCLCRAEQGAGAGGEMPDAE